MARFQTDRLDNGERITLAAGAAIVAGTLASVALEARRVLRARRANARALKPAEQPTVFETIEHDFAVARELAEERLDLARENFQAISNRDLALFYLTCSFFTSATLARGIAFRLRRSDRVGPFRNLQLGQSHIHHFVPGIALAFSSGGLALLSEDGRRRASLAIPFGIGLGLTFDESALLLRMRDVYWQREGLLGIQLTLGVLAGITGTVFAARLLRPAGTPIELAPSAAPLNKVR